MSFIATADEARAIETALASLSAPTPKAALKVLDSPTRQLIDGTAGKPADLTEDDQRFVQMVDMLDPAYSDMLTEYTVQKLERLAEQGFIRKWKHGKVTSYHPLFFEGTGYIQNAKGELINGGYGFFGPNGNKFDEEMNPWTAEQVADAEAQAWAGRTRAGFDPMGAAA